MMKKKLLAILIACLCVTEAATVFVPVSEPLRVEAATKSNKKTKKAPSLNKVYKAVKAAYGDDYIPNVRQRKSVANDYYGLKSSWYSEIISEVSLVNVHCDELVIVKAKNDASKKKIKNALKKHRELLKEDAIQYSTNLQKIQASKVFIKGDYVCFFVLGSIDNKTEEQGEAKALAAYKKQNKKAVKAINKLYK